MADHDDHSDQRVVRGSVLLADNKFVKIFVGPLRHLFTIHEKRLCERIPYFKAAFTGKFREGTEKSMDMPEDDPPVFAELVNYVYSGGLECACSPGEEDLRGENESDDVDPRVIGFENEITWCALWILADKLGCKELQQLTLDRLGSCLYYHGTPTSMGAATINYVYDKTLEGSELRTMVKDEFCFRYFTKCKTPALKGKWAKDLNANETFAGEVLEQIEQHCKKVDCSFVWSYKCFVHRPDNPLQKMLAKKRQEVSREDSRPGIESSRGLPVSKRSRVHLD